MHRNKKQRKMHTKAKIIHHKASQTHRVYNISKVREKELTHPQSLYLCTTFDFGIKI